MGRRKIRLIDAIDLKNKLCESAEYMGCADCEPGAFMTIINIIDSQPTMNGTQSAEEESVSPRNENESAAARYKRLNSERNSLIKRKSKIQKAREYLMIGYSQYVKEKTKARSRKKAVSDVFADLKAYDYSYISIQDAYGFDAISNNERERLLTLLDAYEDSKKDKGDKFSDEVTEIMDAAIGIIDDMLDELFMKEAINDVDMSDTEKVIEEEENEYLRKAQEE